MRVQILDANDNVIATIICDDEAFLNATYGDRWRVEPQPEPQEP